MANNDFKRYENTLEAERILQGNQTSIPAQTAIQGSLALRDSPIEELPPDLDIFGSLNLSCSNVKKLNEGLRIFGDLILSYSQVESLPSGIFIEGNLVLKNSMITELPTYLTCYGEIDLAESRVKKLSDHLTVRCISLANTLIQKLTRHLTVESAIHSEELRDKPSYLDLKNSSITHIPDYAEISSLNLLDTEVATYGRNVRIEYLTLGSNKLTECFSDSPEPKKNFLKLKNAKHTEDTGKISISTVILERDEISLANALELKPHREIIIAGSSTHIPAGTQFECSLELNHSTLTTLPEDLKINGYLTILDSPLQYLPASIRLAESLVMQGEEVVCAFPPELRVRDLELYGTSQRSLPEKLFAPGYVILRDSLIEKLPLALEVGMNLIIRNNRTPLLIPDKANIKVGKSLFWKGAPFESWPRNMLVCGGIFLAESAIRTLPNNFLVNGTLDLNDSQIEKLPEDLTILGDLLIKNTAITSLPESLKVAGKIDAEGTALSPEQCAARSGKSLQLSFIPSWQEADKSYAWFDRYDGCELIENDGNRKLIRPLGQEKQIWIEKNEAGGWIGEYPSFKPDYPEYGY